MPISTFHQEGKVELSCLLMENDRFVTTKGRTAGFGQREGSAQNGGRGAEPCGQKTQIPSLSPICREKTSVTTELCTFIERGASVINIRGAGAGFCLNPPPTRRGAFSARSRSPACKQGGRREAARLKRSGCKLKVIDSAVSPREGRSCEEQGEEMCIALS